MFYYFSGWDLNSGAWATSHFDPDLKIAILGSTEKEEGNMRRAANIAGEIIGRWYESQRVDSTIVIYRNSGRLMFKESFKDGSSQEKELKESKSPEGTRYDYVPQDGHGEYFVLNRNGDLSGYDKLGLVCSPKPIKE